MNKTPLNLQINLQTVISSMTRNDIEFVKNLEIECNLSNWSETDYLDEIDRDDSFPLIISAKNQKIGFLVARMLDSGVEREVEIYNLAILPSLQNQGFGQVLITHLINQCSKNNVTKIWLEVRKSNIKAIKFYQKNTFVEVGSRKNFYTNPPEDAILMCRTEMFNSI
jgi:[ribosomal protein S18]-alanine N-acetyltransferase